MPPARLTLLPPVRSAVSQQRQQDEQPAVRSPVPRLDLTQSANCEHASPAPPAGMTSPMRHVLAWHITCHLCRATCR